MLAGPTPEASAVVVHHRGLEHLLESLAALEASTREGLTLEILLVDNASGAPQDEILRRHPTVRRIPSARNVGFAAGCRLGVEAARAPCVLFVNDDAAVLPDAPRLLVSALASAAADVAAVGGRMTDRTGRRNDFSDGFLTFDGHAFAAHVGRAVESLPAAAPGEERLFASGGFMAVRRAEFLESGGFDDDYFAYLEDVDFGWRQWIGGRRILAEPRAVARHRGGATGEALGVFSRGFLYEKNAFSTAYKNFDAEHFRDLMPAVLMAFVNRVAQMLAARNPGAAELKRDPYAATPAPSLARTLFGVSEEFAARVSVDDPLTHRPPARAAPGSTATTRAWPRSGGSCRPGGAARMPRSSRSSRCASCRRIPGTSGSAPTSSRRFSRAPRSSRRPRSRRSSRARGR